MLLSFIYSICVVTWVWVYIYRYSRPEPFCKKAALRNFTKFTGKHLCQSLFFNKVAGLRPATLSKKRLWRRCFPVNFVKFVRPSFFTEHLRWLLLYIYVTSCLLYSFIMTMFNLFSLDFLWNNLFGSLFTCCKA